MTRKTPKWPNRCVKRHHGHTNRTDFISSPSPCLRFHSEISHNAPVLDGHASLQSCLYFGRLRSSDITKWDFGELTRTLIHLNFYVLLLLTHEPYFDMENSIEYVCICSCYGFFCQLSCTFSSFFPFQHRCVVCCVTGSRTFHLNQDKSDDFYLRCTKYSYTLFKRKSYTYL